MGVESAGAPKERGNDENIGLTVFNMEKSFDYGTHADRLATGLGSGGMGEITVPGVSDALVEQETDKLTQDLYQKYFDQAITYGRERIAAGDFDEAEPTAESPTTPTVDAARERVMMIIDEPGVAFDDAPAGQVDAQAYIHPTRRDTPGTQE